MLLGSLTFVLILIGFSIAIFRLSFFQNLKIPKIWIFGALTIKLIASFVLVWIYTTYYPDRNSADIFKYFDDAISIKTNLAENKNLNVFDVLFQSGSKKEIQETLKSTQHWDPKGTIFINDNRTIISLNLLLLYLSQGFYPIHALVFSLLCFLGLLALYDFFKRISNLSPRLIFILTFISPSLMLWTSGILKESWLFFCLGFTLYFSQKLKEKFSWNSLFLLLLFVLLLAGIKQYVFLFILPFILNVAIPKVKSKLILTASLFILIFSFLSFDFILKELQNKLVDFNQLALDTRANSYFKIKDYSSKADFVLGIPEYIYNVLLRPIIPNKWNVFSILNSLESLVLFILLMPLLWWKKSSFNKRILGTLILYLFLTTILIGSTIPILGALIRYRIVLIPFYLIFIFSFYKFSSLYSLIKKS